MAKKKKYLPAGRQGWSGKVTKSSIALDLEKGVFTWNNPKRIAQSLKNSAEQSTRRKARDEVAPPGNIARAGSRTSLAWIAS